MQALGVNPTATANRFGALQAADFKSAASARTFALPADTVQFSGQKAVPPNSSYGHMPYNVADATDLEPVYPNSSYLLHKDAAKAFRETAAAAAKDGITIMPISAFRTRERQVELFYGEAEKRGITLEERAKVCAPPGYSEHHTGYTVDLKDNTPGTTLEETFETTPAFQWMLQNGHRFGWHLSFPRGNRQGVMYEPWHWRWEGDATSRKLFEAARKFNGLAG